MKLCMGCMNQMDDNLYTCPHCGFNETNLRQESYYLDPGTIIGGKFIVGKVLSYGGYTVAYMGMDAEHERKVIIKEYLPSDFSTRSDGETDITIYSGDALEQFEQGLTNFLNEANRIQTLQDPQGIAKVYDCIAENDTGYVITEYLEGQTLKEILDGGKRYSVDEAKHFITQILRGLCKVHPMNIIHCDISPETIFVTTGGEIKLLDFGATRYVTTANSKSLAIILKQGYAPEEQYRSRGVRGTWTDVYALGAVMYRMITGAVPQESVERALVDELKDPSKLGVNISPSVENALMNALNVFQEERTQSAKEFLDELNSANTKRIKVKKRKNDIGKFPMWAKVLVACLFCAVLVGGVALYKIGSGDSGDIVKEDTVMVGDFTGITKEEARKRLDADGYEGVELVFGGEEYNVDAENGTISRQEPKGGSGMPDDWKLVDGKVQGTLKYYLNTNERISYQEIRGLSAYSLAKKLGDGWDIFGDKFVQGDGDGEYFEILGIELSDGTVVNQQMIYDGDQSIALNDIVKISYCANDFFYWESFGNYVGRNISEFSEMLYKKENENSEPKETGETKPLSEALTLIDDSYYSFVHDKGYIFEQTAEQGTLVDVSAGIDGALFHVVGGEKLSYGGKKGAGLKAELEGLGFSVDDLGGSANGTHEVDTVKVVNEETGEEVSVFSTDSKYLIKITTKQPPKKTVVKEEKEEEEEEEEITVITVNPDGNSGSGSGEEQNDSTHVDIAFD